MYSKQIERTFCRHRKHIRFMSRARVMCLFLRFLAMAVYFSLRSSFVIFGFGPLRPFLCTDFGVLCFPSMIMMMRLEREEFRFRFKFG